jgi:hypothetical protein
MSDPFDIKVLRINPNDPSIVPRPVGTPLKIRKRREQFIKVPWVWAEKLMGASGRTYAVALHLLHLHWKNRGGLFRLPNGMLQVDGIDRSAKWRAITDLEQRGLIAARRRAGQSPIIELFHLL